MTALIVLLATASAAATEAASPAMLDEAVRVQASGDHEQAAALLFRWLRAAPRADPGYDVAQHLLAGELQALGLSHAAIVREVEVAANRARPELLPEALTRLEEWTTQGPHDEERVIDELLHGTEFGTLPNGISDWVSYHQGARDLRAGRAEWARARFAALASDSPWRARARLLELALRVDGDDDAKLVRGFEELAKDPHAPESVRNEARMSAARIRFDRGEAEEAVALYEAVKLPELDPGQGRLYLELAWAHYRAGRGGRAMGLLVTLDSPLFRGLFLPEKHLLRAFVFKDACQPLESKAAARELERRFRAQLTTIRERKPLVDDPVLSSAALEKGRAHRLAGFLRLLETERDLVESRGSVWKAHGLHADLLALYDAALAEARRARSVALAEGVEAAADALLHAVEQAGLVDYEVGLSLYSRARGDVVPALTFENVVPEAGEAAFAFDGEFWNDELRDIRFSLQDRCLSLGAR